MLVEQGKAETQQEAQVRIQMQKGKRRKEGKPQIAEKTKLTKGEKTQTTKKKTAKTKPPKKVKNKEKKKSGGKRGETS